MQEADAPPQPRQYNPTVASLVTVATFFGSQILAAVVVTLVPYLFGLSDQAARDWYEKGVLAKFLLIAITGFLNFYILSRLLKRWRIPLVDVGLNKPQVKHMGLAVLGFGLYLLVYLIAVGLLSLLVPGLDVEQEQELGFAATQSAAGLFLVFVSLVIIPPFVEEFVMRGFLFTGLRTKLSFYYATLITSTLFAVAHLPAGVGGLLWIGAIDTFVLSIVLCYLRERYKSLWPPIGVHMLKNGLAFTIVFLLGDVIR